MRDRAPSAPRCDSGHDRPLASHRAPESLLSNRRGPRYRIHPPLESENGSSHSLEDRQHCTARKWPVIASIQTRISIPWPAAAARMVATAFRALEALLRAPSVLYLAALAAMLLRPP